MTDNNDLNNFAVFLRIIQSLKEDGALERDDWAILLPLMIRLVQALKQQINGRPFLIIALAGVEKVLEETLETITED
jgi:hypothetical protein